MNKKCVQLLQTVSIGIVPGIRIASLSPATTEILYAFGMEDQIVCTDQFSNFPDDARALPHVKDMVKIDPQEIAAFEPELVLLGTSIQNTLAEELRTRGFSVVHDDPRSLGDIYNWIRSLGTIFEKEKEAEEVILSMQQGFNTVKQKTTKLPHIPHIYIEEWPAIDDASAGRHEPPFASANWVPEVARMGGGLQMPQAQTGELSPEVTLEQVQEWDPELIIISWCGAGDLADKELIMKRAGWDALQAVQSGAVRVIDDSLLNRPGPRLPEGANRVYSWIFELLH